MSGWLQTADMLAASQSNWVTKAHSGWRYRIWGQTGLTQDHYWGPSKLSTLLSLGFLLREMEDRTMRSLWGLGNHWEVFSTMLGARAEPRAIIIPIPKWGGGAGPILSDGQHPSAKQVRRTPPSTPQGQVKKPSHVQCFLNQKMLPHSPSHKNRRSKLPGNS